MAKNNPLFCRTIDGQALYTVRTAGSTDVAGVASSKPSWIEVAALAVAAGLRTK